MERKEIAKFIDHTQLSACATESDIKKLNPLYNCVITIDKYF